MENGRILHQWEIDEFFLLDDGALNKLREEIPMEHRYSLFVGDGGLACVEVEIRYEEINGMSDYNVHVVKTEQEIELFWQWRDKYMKTDILPNSTFSPSTAEDYEWFFSQEYRDVIMEAFYRDSAILQIVFFRDGENNIGFAVYVIYHSEAGKCLIVEFNIDEQYRNKGTGTMFFHILCEHVRGEGAEYLSLNLSNENNKRFWQRNGFEGAGKDEHGSDVYERRL